MNTASSFPHGSAQFARDEDVRRAFKVRGGLPIGFHRGRMLYHSKGAGALLLGGAGSGKFTSVLSHIMNAPGRKGAPPRYLILDPKGEMAAVIGHGLIAQGAHGFFINPYNLHGLPNHSAALLAHLKPDSQTLVADARRVARTLAAESENGNARFFEQKAQNWLDALVRGLVFEDGEVSFQSLYQLVGMIRSAPDAWETRAGEMAAKGSFDLDVSFKEMIEMAAESRRTYDSVMSEITNALSFMADPNLQNTLVDESQADFTLDVLTADNDRPVFVFVVMPAELIAQNAAFIRQVFSSLRTLKQRAPHAPCVNLVMDEAAQLGSFQEIAEFYAIGRGFGISPLCVYQDIGQIHKNLGPTGAMSLSASADVEIYLGGGISDLHTAEHLSRKLGNQTLVLDDPIIQARAAKAKREALHGMLFEGRDPIKTGMELAHLDFEISHVKKQSRALMSPDEILSMDASKALVWASGYNIRPFMLDKIPYFDRSEYAGRYFPNPYFDAAMDRLKVKTRIGKRWRAVIEERVPPEFEDYPQYRNGSWRFIEGYRPHPKVSMKSRFLQIINK